VLKPISITAISSISPLGKTSDEVWEDYKKEEHSITEQNGHLVSALTKNLKAEILKLRERSYSLI